MVSRAEIEGGIQAGINRVESTFSQLTEEQLDTKVHDGPNGWTARHILAHLAGRHETYELLISMAEESHGAPPGNLDMDSWNQRLVNERLKRSRDDLLREFRSTHERLIERVAGMRDDHLRRVLVLPNRETTLGDVLIGSGGMHSIQHAEEVEEALGIPK